MEADTNFLTIYNGGSEQAENITMLTRSMNETQISTPSNQLFVVLNSKEKSLNVKFNATVLESK